MGSGAEAQYEGGAVAGSVTAGQSGPAASVRPVLYGYRRGLLLAPGPS